MTAELTMDEVMLFDRHPGVLPLYAALREKLAAAYPRMTLKVSKTQVSFRERYVFAMASPPWWRVRGWPERYLLVSFGLSHRSGHPRVASCVEAYPGRWTHHVVVARAEELDGELMALIDEAYRFSMVK